MLAPSKNLQAVGVRDGKIAIAAPRPVMTKHEAINLAAWLVAVADCEDEFNALLAELQGFGVRVGSDAAPGDSWPGEHDGTD